VTREERDLRVESLRVTLRQARETLTAEPTDANLRVVERLREDLVEALKERSRLEVARGRRRGQAKARESHEAELEN
jgi:hypothetical protein